MTDSLEHAVRESLRRVKYPEVAKDVVASGIVRKVSAQGSEVVIELILPTMVAPAEVGASVEQKVREAAQAVAGVRSTRLDVSVKVAHLPPPADKNRLAGVKNVIAVASGKGGVGKSTVATNLALAMKRWGAKVGVLDADVFGPSIPQMLGTPEQPPMGTDEGQGQKKILPAVYYGMPVLSIGFFVEKDGAVIWRGPMVHRLLSQFVEDTSWGELDYLIIDLPPGTGDVQLSLSQLVPLGGAVMVTTPQEVALIDVAKGISMWNKVEVPILGVVENMSYYVCPSCGHNDEIFARGGGRKLAEESGVPFLGEVPIDTKVRLGGDTGTPVVIGAPDSPHAKIFMDIAAKVAQRIVSLVLSGPRRAAQLVTIR